MPRSTGQPPIWWQHNTASDFICAKKLKIFNMKQIHPISAHIISRNKIRDDPYHLRDEEKIIDKQRYLTTVGGFTSLTTHTIPNIAFVTNILARHCQNPTARHWKWVKHLMRYLRGIEDLKLHYRKVKGLEITWYADSKFKIDEVARKSQTWYIFIRDGTLIFWKSVKQTITATSTNHAKFMAFHEAAMGSIWLRIIEDIIMQQCRI